MLQNKLSQLSVCSHLDLDHYIPVWQVTACVTGRGLSSSSHTESDAATTNSKKWITFHNFKQQWVNNVWYQALDYIWKFSQLSV